MRRARSSVLPIFRYPLAVSARVRSVPDLFDRARLATVAVLAGFAALGLALVAHLAISGGPVTVPGLSGLGKVLTTPAAIPHSQAAPTSSPGPQHVIGTGATPGAVAGAGNHPAAQRAPAG